MLLCQPCPFSFRMCVKPHCVHSESVEGSLAAQAHLFSVTPRDNHRTFRFAVPLDLREPSATVGGRGRVGTMPRKEIIDRIQKYVQPFRITKGAGFQLKSYDPGNTCGLKLDKGEASELLQQGTEWLAQEQDVLYAQDRWSLLLVFQAMDAAGKDSTIKHVMSGVNPQGCQVFSFKQPSQEDLNHDFMWRYSKCLPERGRIGIFNRSY